MAKKIQSGADKAAIRATSRKNAPKQEPPERRVTCTECNGAGRTGSEYYSNYLKKATREICDRCNGAGQVTA